MKQKKQQPAAENPEDKVEEALLKRALGFSQQEIHVEDVIDKNTGEILETAKRRSVIKEVLPDVRALLFWLKNRKPQRWKDRCDAPDEQENYDFDPDEKNL